MGGVQISPNMKRTREMIDTSGNIIDPETKTIVELNTPGYVPTKEEIEKNINLPAQPIAVPEIGATISPELESIIGKQTVQERINAAKQLVADLELEKKAEIQRMKEELARLENE